MGQLGQAGVRAGHQGGVHGDQGARLAGDCRVQEPALQRLPPESYRPRPVPHEVAGAGQVVGDQGGHRLAVRVCLRLRQRLAELPFRLGELA